jgi:hypothetical protein
MKVVDVIDTDAKVEKLTEQEQDDLFTKLILGKDVTEVVDTSRGRFEMKFPKPKDILSIGRLAASRRNYKPSGAFDGESEMFNVMASTLDVVVINGPDWFESARITNKNFSFLEVPSREFIFELYGKASSFRVEVEECFVQDKKPVAKRVPAAKSAAGAVDSGAFEGLSNESRDAKS